MTSRPNDAPILLHRPTAGSWLVGLVALFGVLGASACSSGPTGPAALSCSSGSYFTALPVALGDIDAITVLGGLGAPGHTLPTDHTGIYLLTEGATVLAPGAMQITGLRRTTYITSPSRPGHTDFTADFQLCAEVTGWFGHLSTIASSIPSPSGGWKDCQRYSTSDETVETCRGTLDDVTLAAGQPLGTSGFSIALGLMSVDVGLLDSRVTNSYVAPWRYPPGTFRAICPWDQFEPAIKAQLYTKLGDKSRLSTVPAGEPRCGTMVVDVAGTAKGVWALPSETQPVRGNETGYITLANYPYRPQVELALSVAPVALGATVAVVARAITGRVNRAFEQVTNDGLIYCYGPDARAPGGNWLLALTGPSALRIRRVQATGAVPNICAADPSTWSLDGAISMVR